MPFDEPELTHDENQFAEVVDAVNRTARIAFNRYRKGGNRAQPHPAIPNCSCQACKTELALAKSKK